MMTTLVRSQTLAFLPNSRLKTPIVPGPQTSCVISTSAFTQIFSPACTRFWPAARARIFSVKVIKRSGKLNRVRRSLQHGKSRESRDGVGAWTSARNHMLSPAVLFVTDLFHPVHD